VRRVGIRDPFGESAPLEALFPHHGLTAEAVVEATRSMLGVKRP
jgi:transketolase